MMMFKTLTTPAALVTALTLASAPAWAGQRDRHSNNSGQERGRAVERSQGQRSDSPRAETPRSEPRQGAPAQGNEPRRDVAIPRDEPRRDSIAPRYEQRNAPRYEPRYAPRYDSKYGSRYDSRSYGSRGGYGNGAGYGYPFIGDEGRIRPGTDRLSKQLRNSL